MLSRRPKRLSKACCWPTVLTSPYIHDLGELIRLLEQSGEQVPDRVREAAQLTDYAVEACYPGLAEAVDRHEHQEALGLAEDVVHWVETRLAARQQG